MKRSFWKAMVISGALVMAMGVQAQVKFSADFSGDAGYVDGPVVGQPASGSQWIDANPGAPATSIAVVDDALAVIGDGVGGKWIYVMIPVQKDIFYVSFDGIYTGDGTMANIGVSLSDTVNFNLDGNPAPTYNEQGAMVRFADNGLIDSRNGDGAGGGSFTKLADVPYNDGVKFFVRMEVDPAAGFVNVFVKKDGDAAETTIAQDFTFRRFNSVETDGCNCIVIFDNNSDRSLPGIGITFDNFTIYGAAPVAEWSLF
ncbi:MAG: hypothetical protein GC154_17450 [bacterium]|nr:hypothetical protein [bacterium]